MGLRGPDRRFTDEMVAEAKTLLIAGTPVDEVCQRFDIGRSTFFRNGLRGSRRRQVKPSVDERVKLVRRIQRMLDRAERSLESLDENDLNLSVSQSLTALAHLRQWVVDIEDCILIDQKLELSG